MAVLIESRWPLYSLAAWRCNPSRPFRVEKTRLFRQYPLRLYYFQPSRGKTAVDAIVYPP